jgi:hypothetical protein
MGKHVHTPQQWYIYICPNGYGYFQPKIGITSNVKNRIGTLKRKHDVNGFRIIDYVFGTRKDATSLEIQYQKFYAKLFNSPRTIDASLNESHRRQNSAAKSGNKNSFFGKKHDDRVKNTIGLANSKEICQLDSRGQLVAIHVSQTAAGKLFGKGQGNISTCAIKNLKDTSKLHMVYGYAWMFKYQYLGLSSPK